MALASLVPFQGPKKSRFSGPTPSNAPRNDVAPLKTITYRAIKTTGTFIVIVMDAQQVREVGGDTQPAYFASVYEGNAPKNEVSLMLGDGTYKISKLGQKGIHRLHLRRFPFLAGLVGPL